MSSLNAVVRMQEPTHYSCTRCCFLPNVPWSSVHTHKFWCKTVKCCATILHPRPECKFVLADGTFILFYIIQEEREIFWPWPVFRILLTQFGDSNNCEKLIKVKLSALQIVLRGCLFFPSRVKNQKQNPVSSLRIALCSVSCLYRRTIFQVKSLTVDHRHEKKSEEASYRSPAEESQNYRA